jgi:hypothetical protein
MPASGACRPASRPGSGRCDAAAERGAPRGLSALADQQHAVRGRAVGLVSSLVAAQPLLPVACWGSGARIRPARTLPRHVANGKLARLHGHKRHVTLFTEPALHIQGTSGGVSQFSCEMCMTSTPCIIPIDNKYFLRFKL